MLDQQRLPTNFDRKPYIRNKVHKKGVCTPETQQQRGKEILPFVTQYQPSASTVKEALIKNWNLIQDQPLLRQMLKNHLSLPKKFPKGDAR